MQNTETVFRPDSAGNGDLDCHGRNKT